MNNKSRTNIGIFGIGAIGSVMAMYADLLPDTALYYFNRSAKSEMDINGPIGEISKSISLGPSHEKLDWLLVCIKEYHYENALPDILKLINPTTKIVLIRNGLHLEKSLNNEISNHRILPCMIDCATEKIGSKIKYYNHPKLSCPDKEMAQLFKAMFTNTPLQIYVEIDFLSISWMKLIESACLGAIMTLNNDTARIFKITKFKIQYQKLLEECILVAKADKAIIPDTYLNQMLDKLVRYDDEKGSSMLTDYRNGNVLELNAKNGIIAALSKQYEISTPLHDLLYKKLKTINNSIEAC